MVPSPPDQRPDDPDATAAEPGDWQTLRDDIGTAWSVLDLGKAAVPVLLGCVIVAVPYTLIVAHVTNALVAWIDELGPTAVYGLVVFFTLTIFSSFLFSAVMLVERLLPWDSPISLGSNG